MATIGVVYGTGEGQTAAVAERIVETLRERGHDATAFDLEAATPDVDAMDAVIVGSSIHMGRPNRAVISFLEEHADAIAAIPSAYFQVSLSSAVDDPDRRAEAARYVEELLTQTGFEPDRIATFGGALKYSEYGFLKRAMLKRIAAESTGDTDTSRDYEYTDWEAVAAFTEAFAAEAVN